MALSFFTQKEIAQIGINDIPEEFINYFDDLNYTEKQRIYEIRPDLATALGFNASLVSLELREKEEDTSDYDLTKEPGEENETTDEEKIDLTSISQNLYEGEYIPDLIDSGLDPLEMLTLQRDQEKCKIHDKRFEQLQLSYSIPNENGTGIKTFGIAARYCNECNRLFVSEDQVDTILERLSGIIGSIKIYPLEETGAYIRSCLPEIEVTENDVIYVSNTWVEENPVCEIHDCKLEEYPHFIKKDSRSIRFNAYICEKCNKSILRKTKALELEEKCAEVGVPLPRFEPLVNNTQKRPQPAPKMLKPDYYIQDGKRKEFTFSNTSELYCLDERDTIAVSDSMYCNMQGHETKEMMVVFPVVQKRDGKKNYVCLAGFCPQCQKYYLSEEDYKVFYPLGRPMVSIITDLEQEDIYKITSGEVFELEKGHLKDLEDELEEKTEKIYQADDYVNPYATYSGGYDEGGLKYSKEASKLKYAGMLDMWNGFKPRPYTYRVDLIGEGDSRTYYLGASNIQIDDNTRVVSFNDRNFGAKLANIRTQEIEIDGKIYKIKLSRQFDIDNAVLFGYVNLKTDEDAIFRKGITDPFLVKVLKLRKKQHNLIDIIATIQENQNAIVDEKFQNSIIVQGCAGSGKTMVLLHRLSSLKYNYPDFDFSNTLILTPNEQFNLHIQGIVESLQVGFAERLSVEQYYVQLLREFSKELVPQNDIASEVFVNQSYVDYIYSDVFKDLFNISYRKVIQERQNTFSELQKLCRDTKTDYPKSLGESDGAMMPIVERLVSHISAILQERTNKIVKTESAYMEIKGKLSEAENRVFETKSASENVFPETLPRVQEKLKAKMEYYSYAIPRQQELVKMLSDQIDKNRGIFAFSRRERLAELEIAEGKAIKLSESFLSKNEEAKRLVEEPLEGKSDEELFTWLRGAMYVIPEVQEEIRNCARCKNAWLSLQDTIGKLTEKHQESKDAYETALSNKVPEDTEKLLMSLEKSVKEYSDIMTYTQVFERAVKVFKESNNIKVNKGVHRYDLYARLLFCMKYYDRPQPGSLRFICVDEGQDLSINEYRLIYEMNHRNVIFNVYGDVNQLLKPGRGISDWKLLKEEFSMREYQLNENYRNTNQITRFCNSSFEMDVMQTGVDGPAVREIPRRELERELASVNTISGKVAVLVPRCVQRRRYLHYEALPYDTIDIIGQKIGNGLISLMYVDEVKGIEFNKVYVVPNKMSKNEKYIAYTRALDELVIVVDENVVEQEPSDENEETQNGGELSTMYEDDADGRTVKVPGTFTLELTADH